MRLSEAIRLGAVLRPQAFGGWFPYDPLYGFRSCVLGSALEGIGALEDADDPYSDPYGDPYTRVLQTWPFPDCKLECRAVVPGSSSYVRFRLASLIIHLNDVHRWTREQIADWLVASGLDVESNTPNGTGPGPGSEAVPADINQEELVCA